MRSTLWFGWQILHQEKYLHLILPAKPYARYHLPQKASLLLCFLEKKIRNYDDSNKNYDAARSLTFYSKIPKAI